MEFNPNLGTWEGLRAIWLDVEATPQYYPLVHSSYWVEHQLWGLDPAGYHRTNILLHALSAFVLWRLLVLLGVPAAWAGAALFALHPVQVESVAWITERKNVLSTLFYLLSAWTYLRFVRPPQGSLRAIPRGAWALAFLLFTAALLSKTVTASLPAALLVIYWWQRGRIEREDAVPLIPFFLLGVALGALTVWIESNYVGASGESWSLTPLERVLVAGRIVWFYAAKLLWPDPLIFVYPRWQVDAGAGWQYLFPATALLLVFGLWAARRYLGRGPLAAVLLFGGTLVPALGFFDVYPMQYSYVADHFQYLATPSLLALFAATAHFLLSRRPALLRLAPGLLALVLGAYGLLTWRQCHVYRDLETLWRDTLDKNPEAWMAHNNLGMLLQERGELDEAIEHYQSTVRLAPEYPFGHNNLGTALREAGRTGEAVGFFRRALELDPDYARAHYNLAAALAAEGRLTSAETHYRRALSLRPEYASAHNNLGNTLAVQGRLDEAIFHFQESLRLRPEAPNTHFNLATALETRGRSHEALQHFEETARLRSDWPIPLLKIAWLLATDPDPRLRDPNRALDLVRAAGELPRVPESTLLDTHAAALAAVGRFDEAIQVAEGAVRAAGRLRASEAAQIAQRLALYRLGEAFVRDVDRQTEPTDGSSAP